MYNSPIELTIGQIQTKMEEGLEGNIIKVVQDVGINVDKDELARALAYDRNQYQKGYEEGLRDGYEKAYQDLREKLLGNDMG